MAPAVGVEPTTHRFGGCYAPRRNRHGAQPGSRTRRLRLTMAAFDHLNLSGIVLAAGLEPAITPCKSAAVATGLSEHGVTDGNRTRGLQGHNLTRHASGRSSHRGHGGNRTRVAGLEGRNITILPRTRDASGYPRRRCPTGPRGSYRCDRLTAEGGRAPSGTRTRDLLLEGQVSYPARRPEQVGHSEGGVMSTSNEELRLHHVM